MSEHVHDPPIDDVIAPPLAASFGWRWWAGIALAGLGLVLLLYGLSGPAFRGVGVWGTNIPYVWGFDIASYAWWIGIANGATLFASILVLMRQSLRTAINRFANGLALGAAICAAIFPIFHLGRPDRVSAGDLGIRRAIQLAYNQEHGITAETVKKGIDAGATTLSARKVLRDSEKVEGKVQEVAGDLHQAIETLGEGVDAQTRAETALAESQEALAGAEAALAESQKGERKAIERALHDATTGLPVRALFDDRLSHGIALAERHDWTLAVMFLDLDKFKAVNDTHGHAAGDRVLKEVARRLTETARDEDTVCRNGGDEFLYLLVNPRGRDDIQRIAMLISKNVARPIAMGDVQLIVPTSIGIALYPDDGKNGEDVLGERVAIARAGRLGEADLHHLRGVVPLVDRRGDVQALVALEAQQRPIEDLRQHLGHLGLADPRLAFEQQGLRQAQGQEQRRREALVDEVVDVGETPGERLDVGRGRHHPRPPRLHLVVCDRGRAEGVERRSANQRPIRPAAEICSSRITGEPARAASVTSIAHSAETTSAAMVIAGPCGFTVSIQPRPVAARMMRGDTLRNPFGTRTRRCPRPRTGRRPR